MKRISIILLLLVCGLLAHASWSTHFAYNNVERIALAGDYVYGLSGGALYRVNRMTEQIEKVDTKFGLHGTGICGIGYDESSEKLLVTYNTGKADILGQDRIEFVPDLYETDMLASKRVNNITFAAGKAYLSMSFGILTFNMYNHSFVDAYYIGSEATEVNVEDVVVTADSIYAFSDDLMYRASLSDNVMDYRNWASEPDRKRIARDADKGQRYFDAAGNVWTSAGMEGVACDYVSGNRVCYKPDGPLTNVPYTLYVGASGRLYMVQGGRWGVQNSMSGDVMIYEAGNWHNISASSIKAATSVPYALDFMHVAEDPADSEHFFVSSYGTGLFEFRGKSPIHNYNPSNSLLAASAVDYPETYTRCDGLSYDDNGNLWVVQAFHAIPNLMCVLKPDGTWAPRNIYLNGAKQVYETPIAMVQDVRHKNWKWVGAAREGVRLALHDDNGTIFDESDDRTVSYSEWFDQDGNEVSVEEIRVIWQDRQGKIWLGTEKGVVIIPDTVDYFTSQRCYRLRIQEGDAYLTENDRVLSFAQDANGYIWVGTTNQGVYVLSEDAKTLLMRYNSGNTAMPSNKVLSLAFGSKDDRMFVGTGEGLVSMSPTDKNAPQGLPTPELAEDEEGAMFRFTLYPSYFQTTQIAVASDRVFGVASGGLYSISRETLDTTSYSKASGLSSSNISLIRHDAKTDQTVVIYEDGHIDLIRHNILTPLNDLYQKAEDMSVVVQSAYCDDKGRCYLGMEFGIVVLNLMKQEVEDTYYIGGEHNIRVLSLTAVQDTIYAVSETDMYIGVRTTNLLDYANWKKVSLPQSGLYHKVVFCNGLYFLSDSGSLYRYSTGWVDCHRVYSDIFVTGNQLLTYDSLNVLSLWEGTSLGVYPKLHDIKAAETGVFWLAMDEAGMACRDKAGNLSYYGAYGPYNNNADNLQFFGQRLFVSNGAYWAVQSSNDADVKIYQNGSWTHVPAASVLKYFSDVHDFVNFAVDPNDEKHFYAASYGGGVIEYRDEKPFMHYTAGTPGCTLLSAADNERLYTRCSGLMLDDDGNLWVLNAGKNAFPVNIMDKNGVWYGLPLGGHQLETPGKSILMDSRDSKYKWFIECREGTGVYLYNDNGSPTQRNQHEVIYKANFIDQYGTEVEFHYLYCVAQDLDGVIWVGSDKGPFMIDDVASFKRGRCSRILKSRNDGTILADYLLATEVIKTIAVDGGNRKWFGTENNGVFLISADGMEQMQHFTTKNSNLPSNSITSIAINHQTGEVFIGTASGLCSYRSDATEGAENFDKIISFPNPVRPNYSGVVTISGLMEDSWVHIVDQAGNVVFKTRSYGGTATWNLTNGRGRRASSGVYSVICYTSDGTRKGGHTKVLVMN